MRHDELAWRVVAGHVVGVDVIRAFVVVDGLELESRVIVGENVGKAIFGSITWQISERAWLVAANMLEFLKFFAKSVKRNRLVASRTTQDSCLT